MSTQQNILEIVDVILCETPLGLAAFCRTKVGHFFLWQSIRMGEAAEIRNLTYYEVMTHCFKLVYILD